MSGYIGSQPVPQATQTRQTFTATSGQTSFATIGYVAGGQFIQVYLNGVLLKLTDDYTAANGSDIVLTSGAATGDILEFITFADFTVNNQNFTGGLTVDNDGATVLTVDRATSNGAIIDLQKSGSSVGIIGTEGNDITIDGGVSNHSGLRFSSPAILPRYNGVLADNQVDLGQTGSNYRFKDLYLSGGVYLGGTGSANYLDDVEAGSFTPTVADATSGGNTSPSYSTRVGFYTKVGRNVNIQITVTNISTSGLTSGNSLFIQGLPFPQSNTNGRSCTGSVRADRLSVDSTCFGVVALVGQGSSTVQLYQNRDNTTDIPVEIGDILSGQADLFISINYDT